MDVQAADTDGLIQVHEARSLADALFINAVVQLLARLGRLLRGLSLDKYKIAARVQEAQLSCRVVRLFGAVAQRYFTAGFIAARSTAFFSTLGGWVYRGTFAQRTQPFETRRQVASEREIAVGESDGMRSVQSCWQSVVSRQLGCC